MKVLVTGPDGILGSNLVRKLLEKGYAVSVLLMEEKLSTPTLDGLPIKKYYGNILDTAALDAAFQNQEIVIHAAASTLLFPARAAIINKINVDGTKNIIDAALKHKIKRLIHVGTANSFGFGSEKTPGNEESPYTADKYGLDYMDSKRKAQEMVLEAVVKKQLPALIVNPTFMIGPYDSKPSSGAMILAIYNKKVPGYTAGGKSYIAVKDAAEAIVNAITLGKIGECYILGNHNLTYKDAFELIATTIGVKKPRIKMSSLLVQKYGAYNSFLAKWLNIKPTVTKEMAIISCEGHYYSSEKAKRELLMPNTPIEAAVKESFEWFKENGYLNRKHV